MLQLLRYVTTVTICYNCHDMLQLSRYVTTVTLCYNMVQYVTTVTICYNCYVMLQYVTICYNCHVMLQMSQYVTTVTICYNMLQLSRYVLNSTCRALQRASHDTWKKLVSVLNSCSISANASFQALMDLNTSW